MDRKTKETLLKAAEFSEAKNEQTKKRFNNIFKIGALSYLLFALFRHSQVAMLLPESVRGFAEGLLIGSALGSLLLGCIMSSSYGSKICEIKKRILRK